MIRLLMAGRLAAPLILAAGFAVGGALAGPYPVAGPDGDPDHCSSRKNQPVLYCVTPPPGLHCQEIMSESAPLYLGYRYECDLAPEPVARPSSSAGKPTD